MKFFLRNFLIAIICLSMGLTNLYANLGHSRGSYHHHYPHHYHHYHHGYYYDDYYSPMGSMASFATGVMLGEMAVNSSKKRKEQGASNFPASFAAEASEDYIADENARYWDIEYNFLNQIKDNHEYRINGIYSHIGGLLGFYGLKPQEIVPLSERLFDTYQVSDALVVRIYIADATVDSNHIKRGANKGFQPVQADGFFYFNLIFRGKTKLVKAKYNSKTFPYFPFYIADGSGKRFVGLFLPKTPPAIFSKNPGKIVTTIENLKKYLLKKKNSKKKMDKKK